ncbi:tripartite motif-containing 59-related [Anaeramoeba flamelloides]|uniref:Tripartite motif-containing 59-related n=1 Tax=Anaeramoeba flamelloides TaxID=1746091 RepID=A0AAV7Y3B3_9EUKA|nr:tripartite motif-containing 59-related [Anaeramoeba flamelloides]
MNNINYPVGIQTDLPLCEGCEKAASEFYCSRCKIYYCRNCELTEVHGKLLKKKHQKYIQNLSFKETSDNIQVKCKKHDQKFINYCKNEKILICAECVEDCSKSSHEIVSLKTATEHFYNYCKRIHLQIKKQEKGLDEEILQINNNQKKFNQEIVLTYTKTQEQSKLLKQLIDSFMEKNLRFLKKNQQIINKKYKKEIEFKKAQQDEYLNIKNMIRRIRNFKKENNIKLLIQEYCRLKESINKKKQRQKNLLLLNNNTRLFLGKGEDEDESEDEDRNYIQNNNKNKNKKYEKKKQENMKLINNLKQLKIQPRISQEKFNQKLKTRTIKLFNNNLTVINMSTKKYRSRVCGKKIYSSGIHEIKMRIDQFPNSENQVNEIYIGVINAENRKQFIKSGKWDGTYYFKTCWIPFDLNIKSTSWKIKEDPKMKFIEYGQAFHQGDNIRIILDMDQKEISFALNDSYFGIAWYNIPKQVCLFISLWGQEENENQISILWN